MPEFLVGHVSEAIYEKWLKRKAAAQVRRDRERGRKASVSQYKEAIHAAVLASNGRDAYTGEPLHWKLISTYRNEDSIAGRHAYKATFALIYSRSCYGWRYRIQLQDMRLAHQRC
jgi:hypothetical protein